MGSISRDLRALSEVHKRLVVSLTNDISYISEVTVNIDLSKEPPKFPKGFSALLGKLSVKPSWPIQLPFLGQHSYFSTDSKELSSAIETFVLDSKS